MKEGPAQSITFVTLECNFLRVGNEARATAELRSHQNYEASICLRTLEMLQESEDVKPKLNLAIVFGGVCQYICFRLHLVPYQESFHRLESAFGLLLVD